MTGEQTSTVAEWLPTAHGALPIYHWTLLQVAAVGEWAGKGPNWVGMGKGRGRKAVGEGTGGNGACQILSIPSAASLLLYFLRLLQVKELVQV